MSTFKCVGLIFVLIASPGYLAIASVPENGTQSYGNNQSIFFREHVSIDIPDAPTPGTLQIPYSGITTKSLTPSFAERLGLEDTARGALITDIIPGSPSERLGLRPLNLSRNGGTDEIIGSRGDIILTVDGSTSFNTEYRGVEQYIIDNKRVAENITLNILRDGQPKEIKLTLTSKPNFLFYEDTNDGFRIKYPSDWNLAEEKKQSEELLVSFCSIETSSLDNLPIVEASVFKYNSEYNISSEAFEPNKGNAEKVFRILNFNVAELGNIPAYIAVSYDYSENNKTRKVVTFFTERDSILYNVNFSIDPIKYDDYLPLITVMIKSFQLL